MRGILVLVVALILIGAGVYFLVLPSTTVGANLPFISNTNSASNDLTNAYREAGLVNTSLDISLPLLESLPSVTLASLLDKVNSIKLAQQDSTDRQAVDIHVSLIELAIISKKITVQSDSLNVLPKDCSSLNAHENQLLNYKEAQSKITQLQQQLNQFTSQYPTKATEWNFHTITSINDVTNRSEAYELGVISLRSVCEAS